MLFYWGKRHELQCFFFALEKLKYSWDWMHGLWANCWRFKEAFEIWKFRFSLYSFKASFPKQNRLYLPRYFIKIPGRKHSTIINFSLLLIYCFYRQVFFYRNFYFSFSLGFPFCPQKKSFFSSGSYFYLLWEN